MGLNIDLPSSILGAGLGVGLPNEDEDDEVVLQVRRCEDIL